ncbi:probable PFY1 - profilin [Ustilago sp. UG-2017a]|uniref:Profilin n=1 Tax=Ustilago bromivora TaxID=307758 RepID=A0A1K0GRB0_9BASI|nr:probable PFY1-profilin [Ustilago bromivora]SOV07422.1 probable PFY1 - profilin [Ustilago sp. UG-2017a]SPC64216.1 probable PFY1 - profilin [Ustilago sp. UG-2017b]
MSWQGYVDTNLVATGKISQAAIIGLKGGVWATSPDFNVAPEEQKAIIAGFDDPSGLQAGGVRANGKKFFTLGVTPKTIYGKQGGDGLVAVKTNQAVLVCVYLAPIVPGEANKVAEGLGDYLISVGY